MNIIYVNCDIIHTPIRTLDQTSVTKDAKTSLSAQEFCKGHEVFGQILRQIAGSRSMISKIFCVAPMAAEKDGMMPNAKGLLSAKG